MLPLQDVCCASVPLDALAALGDVRDVAGVTVALADGRAYVHWEPGEDRLLRAVLPLTGVELFVEREGTWFRHGQHLPAFDFPAATQRWPLYAVVTPRPVQPQQVVAWSGQAVKLTLVAERRPRPASALRCTLAELARWADTVSAVRLAQVRAGHCGKRLLLLGQLPPLAVEERFWGQGVLCPLGHRPEPDWPPGALRQALGIGADELLLLTAAGAEVVPQQGLQPLTREQIHLALEDAAP